MQSLFISFGLSIILYLPSTRSNNCTVPLVYHGIMKKEVIEEPYFDFWSGSYKSDVYYKEIPAETVVPPASTLDLICDNGYSFQGTKEGKEIIICTQGKWQPAPVCLRSFCKVPNIQNGELGSFEEVRVHKHRYFRRFASIHVGKQVKHNKTMVLRCREGFLPGIDAADETDEVMCIDGTWSKPMQCQESVCSAEPPPLEHASPRITSRKHKATLWYQCDDGYGKVKPDNVTCRYGKWDGTPAACADFRCYPNQLNYPGLVKPAQEFLYNGRGFDVECEEAYKKDSRKNRILCSEGQWDVDTNPCKIMSCPDLPIPVAGSVKYLSAQQRTAISRTRNTSRVSSRSGVIHRSQRIPARALETSTAEPYMILHPGMHPVGSKAVIKCESKYYQLFGSRTRRCQKTGKWSGRSAICIPVCGRSESTRSPFIINGNATDIGQWPWQAGIALEDYEGWTMACGASLLNELWVITAAHCVTYKNTAFIIEPDEFQVYLGKYHRNDTKDDEYVQIRKIQEIHVHPDYNPRTYDADIALIQLDSPVELTYRVQPICLPTEQTTRKNLVEGQKGIVTGWGVNENSTFSETLRQAVLPVVSHANCEKGLADAGYRVTITDNMFCAGYKGGSTDTCYGDSGGPVVFADESTKAANWVLEGIISWGIGCGFQNQYGGYTAVSKFLDWIHLYI